MAWWKYLVWTALIVAVFGVSIVVGHWWSSRSYRAAQESTSPAVEAPTQGVPGPVALEILSELEVAKLQNGIDTAVLEQWWQILGVNAQALTLKELGGMATYTPSHVKIIFKDISPLSPETRQGLYKPVSGMPGTPIMAGLSTEPRAEELTYLVWYAPELLADAGPSEAVEDILNRQLFEVLYEATIGSTELDRDDYEAKLEQAFPEHGGGLGIIKLEDSEQSSGVTPSLWNLSAWQLSNLMERISTWQLVPQAQAQSCGGNYKCGATSNNCICSSTGNTCGGNGDTCGPNNAGRCNCSTICVQHEGALENCAAAYSSCGIPPTSACSQCVASNTCGWSGPTPTTGSGQPTPTSTSADYGERCRIDGKVEYYDNRNLTNAANVVKIITDNINENYGTDGSGNYSLDKKYSNVWGNTFTVRVNNPYSTYRTFKVKGNVPNGCSIQDDGKTISCPKGKCYEREDGDLAFNFEEVAPSRPDAKISNVSNLKYGETLTWTVEATDADGNLKDTGLFIHSGGISTAIGTTTNWPALKWIGGQNASSITYKHSDAQGVNTWKCDSSRNGTWTLAAYAKDTGGLVCSGNPMAGEARCDTSDDRKVFTCSPSPSPTPTIASNVSPVASFIQYPGATVESGATAQLQGRCTDSNGNLADCYMLRRQRPAGESWSGWSAAILPESSTNGTGTLTTDLYNWVCYSNQAGMGHEWVVEAVDKNGLKCTGKADKPSGWGDCSASDQVVFTCMPPSACGGSIPSGAEAHDDEERTDVPPQHRLDLPRQRQQYQVPV